MKHLKDIIKMIDDTFSDIGTRNTLRKWIFLMQETMELEQQIISDIGMKVFVIFQSEKYAIVGFIYDESDKNETQYKYMGVIFENERWKRLSAHSTIEAAVLDSLAYLKEGIDRRANIYAAKLLGITK